MVSVLDLMHGGFPSRTAFKDLYDMYASVLPPQLVQLDPRTFAKVLLKALAMTSSSVSPRCSSVQARWVTWRYLND